MSVVSASLDLMPNLLDPLTDDQRHLLRVIAAGRQAAGEQWPVWQYVVLRLNADGKNAEDIFNSLPTWLHSYRPVFDTSSTLSLPSPEQHIGLTIQGMVAVDHPATNPLILAFVRVLAMAEQWQRAAIPDPRSTVEIRQPLAELLTAKLHATRPPTVEQMEDLLRHEPATWSGLISGDEGWHWDLSRARLSPYRGVATAVDYLERLQSLVGIPEQLPTEVVIGPTSLVEELDHFALAWRLLTKDRILRITRASLIGQLTQPVASQAEFKERCTALADIISNFNLPLGDLPKDRSGSLHRLDDQLDDHESQRPFHQSRAGFSRSTRRGAGDRVPARPARRAVRHSLVAQGGHCRFPACIGAVRDGPDAVRLRRGWAARSGVAMGCRRRRG
jgi:hypothetical protein